MAALILFIMRFLVFFIEILLAMQFEQDENAIHLEKKALLISAAILMITSLLGNNQNIAAGAAASFFWGSLLAAAYSDWQIKQAYHFFFYIALIAAIISIFMQGKNLNGCIGDVLIFFLLQGLIFRRMYGLADCMAFSVCSVFFAAQRCDLFGFLCLMGVTFLILFFVQMLKKNLNKSGNLKKPVALIPYITVAAVFFYGIV